MCLPAIQFLCSHEALKVLMVHPNLHLVSCPFQEVPPLLKWSHHGQHLLVMNVIVLFDGIE
jgi:hypothetical protein